VVLLDEPFSNLDVEVRLRLRSELPEVLERCGTGGLLVTHDPEEALAVCDRVAVLQQGVLQQCAPPLELVRRPATAFVARFVLQAHALPVRWQEDRWQCPVGDLVARSGDLPLSPGPAVDSPAAAPGGGLPGEAEVLLRPTDLTVVSTSGGSRPAGAPDAEGADGQVLGREFLGREWLYLVELGGRRLRVRLPLAVDLARGQCARLALAPDAEPILFPHALPLRPAGPAPGSPPIPLTPR
jgi:iron(III) transport system ATP-binding protein